MDIWRDAGNTNHLIPKSNYISLSFIQQHNDTTATTTTTMSAAADPEVNRLANDMANLGNPSESNVAASGLELTFSAAIDDAENLEQLGPVIKQITQTGRQEAFVDQLDALIRKKDGEIERMCNAHYQVSCRFGLEALVIPWPVVTFNAYRNSCKP